MSIIDPKEVPIFDIVTAKLADGRLPYDDSIPRIWGGLGNGQTCAACEQTIRSSDFVMESVESSGGMDLKFHVRCFYVWDAVRRVPRKPPARAVQRERKDGDGGPQA